MMCDHRIVMQNLHASRATENMHGLFAYPSRIGREREERGHFGADMHRLRIHARLRIAGAVPNHTYAAHAPTLLGIRTTNAINHVNWLSQTTN